MSTDHAPTRREFVALASAAAVSIALGPMVAPLGAAPRGDITVAGASRIDLLRVLGRALDRNVLKLFDVVADASRNRLFVTGIMSQYVAMLDGCEQADPERLHQRIHQGHNCWVVPEEERFITKELIESSCMVGTAEDLADRLRALESAGLSQVMLLPPLAVKEQVLQDVATKVMALLTR